MPVITENQLKLNLQNGDIKPVYIIFGDDGYLIDRYEDLIISKTCGKNNDFDLQKFERDVDLQLVFDAVNQFPFAGERRCAVLSEYNFEKVSEEDFERLLSLVSDTYTTATLVLRFENTEIDLKKSSRAKKLFEACQSGGIVAELNHRSAAELAKMLQNGAKKRGKTLDKSTADYMVESCGLDINLLVGELDKVCRYVDSENISKADIDFACTKTVEASVYDYVKRIIACDTRGAIRILNDLFYMRVEPMYILFTVSSAFVDMARVSAAGKLRVPITAVAADFPYKNKDFVLKNAAANLKKFTDLKLNFCFDEILSADKAIKSFSGNDKFTLEQMTVRLIYIIAHGDKID